MMIKLPKANYRTPEIIDYEGHPLIEALPPILSPDDVAKMLYRYPVVGENEKSLPGHIRRHAMMRILDQFLFPTRMHIQLEQTISTMLRRGYLSRNIADSQYQQNLDDAIRTDFKAASRNAGNEALVSSVIGCSGAGKSTAVEAILKSYPQAIYHPDFQHTQLVWLKVECPHDGSVKNLCTNFFRAIDSVLDTDYQVLYVKSRSSAESMLGDIARVAALHSLGVLVIDEIQHLEKSRSGGSEKMLNFFVTLTNVLKVPVLFIGTPKALELFKPTMRSARRASQVGSINWGRFERSEPGEPDAEWEGFFKRLWKLQWLSSPTPLTPSMMDLFWEYSQGIAHIAVVLFYLSQSRAVMSGREVIDREIVDKVYKQELSTIHPMIKALQSGRKEIIRDYADLDIPSTTIQNLTQSVDEQPELEQSEPQKEPSKKGQLLELLLGLGIGSDIAPTVADQALSEKPDANIFELVAHISRLEDRKPSKPEKQKATPIRPNYTEGDLRLLRDNDSKTSYANLRRSGVIVDIRDYL